MAELFKAQLLGQTGAKGLGTTIIRPCPSHVVPVASLDKMPNDVYLCFVELKQAPYYQGKLQALRVKLGNCITPKRVRISPKYSSACGVT